MRLAAAINLTPLFKGLLVLVAVGFALFLVYLVGIFIFNAGRSALGFLGGSGDEFGAIVVFWGGVAIVAALITLAFTQHLLTIE